MKISNLMHKVSLIFVALLTVLSISACSPCPKPTYTPPIVVTEVVTKAVKAPRPKVECDFKGEGIEPSGLLLECIISLKRALESVTIDPITGK